MAPARTAPDILARLHRDMAATLADPVVIAKLREQGGTLGATDPAAFTAQIAAEAARWQQVIAVAGIRAEG
jgi:tripartite-type tricarboxylate transporter receptor subunit TctC